MKTTKRLRKKVSSIEFVIKRLEYFMRKERQLTNFFHFECDPFFVGSETAKVNTYIYGRSINRVRSQIRWYRRKLKAMKGGSHGS